MDTITNTLMNAWTSSRKTRTASKGWVSGDAPCCIYNGETPDTKGRGGMLMTGDKISYHCFNCGFVTAWQPGWHLGYKMRNLMSWMGVPESEVKRMVFEALRVREVVGFVEIDKEEKVEISFEPHALPDKAKRIEELSTFYAIGDFRTMPQDLQDVILYASDRGLSDVQISNMYWSSETKPMKMNRRLIIPFKWENKIIGYTARSIDDPKNGKYFSGYGPDFVFNTDEQTKDRKMVFLTEGPMDALAIDGIAVMGNEISEVQAEIVNQLNREVVVVPDKGESGQKLVDAALKYGWHVSFPMWADPEVDDLNAAVCEYGKLFAFKHLVKNKHDTPLKIELMRKKY